MISVLNTRSSLERLNFIVHYQIPLSSCFLSFLWLLGKHHTPVLQVGIISKNQLRLICFLLYLIMSEYLRQMHFKVLYFHLVRFAVYIPKMNGWYLKPYPWQQFFNEVEVRPRTVSNHPHLEASPKKNLGFKVSDAPHSNKLYLLHVHYYKYPSLT